ncbi:MAG: DUF1905 domain-containing protein [Ignavibacteriae bacterium]|nr:DUF1905 domain-containing protein [Ignavibacteriota bacterium]
MTPLLPNEKITSSKNRFRFSSVLEQSTNKLWGCHFRVPNSVAKRFVKGGSRRVFCTLNGAGVHQCALLPHGSGSFVITVNKKRREELGLSFGMSVNVSLWRDETKYGLPLPEELNALLQQDDEGNALFHALTRGRQRTLLYIIGSVKSREKRIDRAIAVVNHLKTNKGRINYKQLNTAMKDPRR